MSDENRELDGWIFENIIGGTVALCSKYCPTCRECFSYEHIEKDGAHKRCGTKMEWDFPHYTTDPAAAMMVFEKCGELCTVTIECSKNTLGEMQWMVSKLSGNHRNDLMVEEWCKCAPTLPLAICLFSKQLFTQPAVSSETKTN